MPVKFIAGLVALATFLTLELAVAQPPVPATEPPADIIRSDVVDVEVLVTVLNDKGKPVRGLTAENFVLLDGATPQQFRFEAAAQPVSMVVAVQTNSGSEKLIAMAKKASRLLQPALAGIESEIAVVAFDQSVQVIEPFTSDPQKVTAALSRLKIGDTQFHTDVAALQCIRMLNERPSSQKKILLLIDQGPDLTIPPSAADKLTHAEINGVLVYTVTMPGKMAEAANRVTPRPMSPVPPEARPAPMGVIRTSTTDVQTGGYGTDVREAYRVLQDMFSKSPGVGYSSLSGGDSRSFYDQKSLNKVIQNIGEELQSQYILTFSARDKAEGFHPLAVKVTAAKKFKVSQVRARNGYWIGSGEDAQPGNPNTRILP